jgi:hypothetical protein
MSYILKCWVSQNRPQKKRNQVSHL